MHTYLYNVDDATFDFLQNVLVETMELFPGRYIHVGGDEAAKDQWHASAKVQKRMKELHIADEAALQSWFIARIEKFIDAHGRKLIGWDEILEGGLAPRATVMSWQGVKGGIEAAKQDHDVVMSPSPALYLDHVQSTLHDEPPGRPDVISVADIYNYEPVPAELDAKAGAPHPRRAGESVVGIHGHAAARRTCCVSTRGRARRSVVVAARVETIRPISPHACPRSSRVIARSTSHSPTAPCANNTPAVSAAHEQRRAAVVHARRGIAVALARSFRSTAAKSPIASTFSIRAGSIRPST